MLTGGMVMVDQFGRNYSLYSVLKSVMKPLVVFNTLFHSFTFITFKPAKCRVGILGVR